VFRKILAEFPEVHITLAGDGPDESWLREYFADSERISFIRYDHQELTAILLNHDIAVVASLGSEGTSLSAIEAMGAGCAVLATCVGGLTNIIIDGYNGKLVLPVEEDLYLALRMLVENETLRERLAAKAYETVQDSFNIVLWKDKWSQVLRNVAAQ
jgi:glycosyltransferase involved in cell wall biosynthesis